MTGRPFLPAEATTSADGLVVGASARGSQTLSVAGYVGPRGVPDERDALGLLRRWARHCRHMKGRPEV